MPDTPAALLRSRTDADLDVLFSIAADLNTWEERNPWAPAPLTRERFDARLARAAESDAPEDAVSFVIDVDGTAVGTASLFDFDSFARHAEAGISLVPDARGRGIGTAAITRLIEFGLVSPQPPSNSSPGDRVEHRRDPWYEKAGFVVEGPQRQHAWVRGAYEDIVLMGILRSKQTTGLA